MKPFVIKEIVINDTVGQAFNIVADIVSKITDKEIYFVHGIEPVPQEPYIFINNIHVNFIEDRTECKFEIFEV